MSLDRPPALYQMTTAPSQGKSALAYGVKSGDAALVTKLMDAKADVNSPINEVRAFRGQGFGLWGGTG